MPALQNMPTAQSVLSLAHRGPQAHRSAPRATYPVTIRNRTHTRGPTVGPQVLATCHPSSCRLLLFFRRHTARAHLGPTFRATRHPSSCAGPLRAHRSAPRAALPATAFSFSFEERTTNVSRLGKMENEMETGFIRWIRGADISCLI